MNFQSVLIVDDDSTTVFLLKLLMERTNFSSTVLAAPDGRQALDLVSQITCTGRTMPDLIFLDLNMPVMNGWEFLEAFDPLSNELKFAPKVVILSSTIDPIDISRAGNYPFVTRFISKPLTRTHLAELAADMDGRV